MVRRGAIALALVAGVAVAGCGGKDKKPAEPAKLSGTVTIGVLAPTARQGELGVRGKDLTDGARMAVDELNRKGGILGKRVQLEMVDDACDAQVAYEAAKSFVTDGGVAGVVGGMCDAAAEHEVPVIDSTGVPFMVTSATADDLVNTDTVSSFLMNGTVYQQALSSVFWMNYRQAQRLAVVQDESDDSKLLARKAIDLIDEAPKLVSLQTVEPGGPTIDVIAKAAIASKPNYVLWTGAAEAGGRLIKALRANGYKGSFGATAQSESPAFLNAAGSAANGAFVTATASPANTPTAAPWKASFEARYRRAPGLDAMQAYDSVRILAHAMQRAKSTDNHAAVVKQISQLDAQLTNSMGVVRFAGDHTLLYDNRVVLEGQDGKLTWKRSLRTDSL